MTHAYDEICLARAADTLGRMLDYAVYSLHYDAATIIDLFIASGDASRFETGDIKILSGMSGTELAYDILERSGLAFQRTQPRYTKGLSAEYWCGYALAHIQWNTCASFSSIMQLFRVQNYIAEYGKKRLAFLESLPLDIAEETRKEKVLSFGYDYASESVAQFLSSAGKAPCALRMYRAKNGLSQSGLAQASGIPVRTIQQYEQGQKDLRKARAEYLIALSRVLGVDPSQLISVY